MSKCDMCDKKTYSRIGEYVNGKHMMLCDECYKKRHYEIIEKNLESVKTPNHFKYWDRGDMSDAFWLHLGKYRKHPNQKSLSVIKNAWYWACHDNHGLSSSFAHALEWCGINLFTELERTDLPAE